MATGSTKPTKITFWHMLRDVLVKSIDKGQFLVAVLALIVIFWLWKMPSEDASRLAFDVLNKFSNGSLIGYGLTGIVSIMWFLHAKHLRRKGEEELKRVTGVRTKLQKKELGDKVVSSTSIRRTGKKGKEEGKS
jgi:hypothetical protein